MVPTYQIMWCHNAQRHNFRTSWIERNCEI